MKFKTILLAVLVAILVAALAYSCRSTGSDEPSAAETTTQPADLSSTLSPEVTTSPFPTDDNTPKTDSDLAEDAARQAMTAMWSWQPAVDASTADGLTRAWPWFSDSLVASTLSTAKPERGPGWQWEQWRSEGTRVLADVSIGCSGCPPDEPDRISRVATIHQTAIKTDGTSKPGDTVTIWLTMTREPAGWRVNELHY
ncbi:hypothetical protein ACIBM3_31150 [Rhodococcus erythropolis]|uniref:hypothetical protein n=1 Tax=Rhodococcus erythropolis TaxID=1833 RepID=UPI00378A0F96